MKNILTAHFILFSYLAAAPLLSQNLIHPSKTVGEAAPQKREGSRFSERGSALRIDGLKVLLVVGDVDGDRGSSTLSYIKNLKEISERFRTRGAKIAEFYSPKNDWDRIKKEAADSHFIIYAGHGVGSTLDPPYIQSKVGGFALKGGIIAPEQIAAELHPKEGAVVMFVGACFSAGNMSHDMGAIDRNEAQKRIVQYSSPFVANGFSAYYATWSHHAAMDIINLLLAGRSYGDAYSIGDETEDVTKIKHPGNENYSVWFNTKSHNGSKFRKIYNYAFVGNPVKTISDSFPGEVALNSEENILRNKRADEQLIYASYKGDLQRADSAIQRGADVNATHEGWTPLMYAAYYGHEEIARLLLGHRADPMVNKDGWSALSLAESKGHRSIAELLRLKGAVASRMFGGSNVPPVPPESIE